jgi:hypothetical protein
MGKRIAEKEREMRRARPPIFFSSFPLSLSFSLQYIGCEFSDLSKCGAGSDFQKTIIEGRVPEYIYK